MKDKELLVQWLESFKSELEQYEEAKETIKECEEALYLFKSVVDPLRVPLLIQNARNARKADGSVLEYGLDYHMKGLNNAVITFSPLPPPIHQATVHKLTFFSSPPPFPPHIA